MPTVPTVHIPTANGSIHRARTRWELTIAEPPDVDPELEPPSSRRAVLRPLAGVRPLPVHWLWDGRIPLGSLTLLAGREGAGKSTLACWLAAQVTRGLLPGDSAGTPRNAVVYSTEEALQQVIVPKLIAAGADMNRVSLLQVLDDEVEVGLHLTRDLDGVARQIAGHDVGFMYLDPITGLLGPKIDTHRDAETRQALDPLVKFAERTGAAVLGLIHLNKNTGAGDVVNQVMGSRAFAAVPRAVHVVVKDPAQPGRRLFATPKNNMGPDDGPTRTFTLDVVTVSDDGTKPVIAPRIVWGEDSAISVQEAADLARQDPEARAEAKDAQDAVQGLLDANGGCFTSAQLRDLGRDTGIHLRKLQRTAKSMRLEFERESAARPSGIWYDPATLPAGPAAPPSDSVATTSAGQVSRDTPGESV